MQLWTSLSPYLHSDWLLFFFNAPATTGIYTYVHTLSLHDALPISKESRGRQTTEARGRLTASFCRPPIYRVDSVGRARSEEHTSELQSLMRISYAVFCLKKKTTRDRKRTRLQ